MRNISRYIDYEMKFEYYIYKFVRNFLKNNFKFKGNTLTNENNIFYLYL